MARFFKPLLGAVALAAATLTSTGAFAAYAYNAQVSITAPKGSTAEAAAKNKTLPVGVKYSTCSSDVNVSGISIKNPDFLQFNVKYDAGKLAGEIGDVYLVLQDLNTAADGTVPTNRYYLIKRTTGTIGASAVSITGYANLAAMDAAVIANSGSSTPLTGTFLAKADNLGSGAQTEVLFGGNLALAGLPKGLWAMSLIIAPPTATYTATGTGIPMSSFLFGRPDTWAAHDTAIFELGSPFAIDAAATLLDSTGVAGAVASATCQ